MNKTFKIVLLVIGAVIVIIIGLRLLTPEDTCIKDSTGKWIPHGHPATPCPE